VYTDEVPLQISVPTTLNKPQNYAICMLWRQPVLNTII